MDGALADAIGRAVSGGIRTRSLDRLAYAHDASHFLLVPQAVVAPSTSQEVAVLLQAAAEHGGRVTFRSGGTSLSGQASTDQILADVRRNFRRIEILDDGARVRVEPGATVRSVNARLARYGRKLGPDPASEVACTVGGVIANNSSGMSCGTARNAYSTIESAVLVLASGTMIDTGVRDADERLRALEPELWYGLARLRDRIRADRASVATIKRLFSIKNTMGYGVNAFVDHERPIDILLHLVVGSEGTLAFVAEVTLRTVPVMGSMATGFLVFPSLADATAALPTLVTTEPASVELLDSTSLRVAQRDPEVGPALFSLDVSAQAALLVEYQESDAARLASRMAAAAEVIDRLGFTTAEEFSEDGASRAALWRIRKGLYAAVAGSRPAGTTALLEDIAVPVANLLTTCAELTSLFDEFGYEDSVIFGHAKDGNLHFMLNERFGERRLLDRYLAFSDRMVDLVLDQKGTLKAEHGTGRVMAPYVRRQYGDDLYEVIREIKKLFDPRGVLGPGVLLSDDPEVHVSNLKASPTVEEEVDRCVECGYCEPSCPSKDLTLTPRQRIVLRREIERARNMGDADRVEELAAAYQYDGVDTCAVDGMCQVSCPVRIDTGELVRRLRAERPDGPVGATWNALANSWGATTAGVAAALSVAKVMPSPLVSLTTTVARRIVGAEYVPKYSDDLPAGGKRRRPRRAETPAAVYMPSCIGRMFSPADGGIGVEKALLAIAERAGIELRVPAAIADMCCGTPWKSKGYQRGYINMQGRVRRELWAATERGRIPVLCDATSCTEGLLGLLGRAHPGIRVVDAVAWVDDQVLPRLTIARRLPSLVIHPTCSSSHLEVGEPMRRIGAAVAERVEIPGDWGCCGFAGDRGMLHPELTASATAAEAASVASAGPFHAYASVNRTCEIALSRATGERYVHVIELLALVSKPGSGSTPSE